MAKKTNNIFKAASASVPSFKKKEMPEWSVVLTWWAFKQRYLDQKCAVLSPSQIDQLFADPRFCTWAVDCVKTWLWESWVATEVAAELCSYLWWLAAAWTLTLTSKVVLWSCNYWTVGQILWLTTNSFSTAANTATSTVNGVTTTSPIINSNSLTWTWLSITSTVNWVASTKDITSDVQALIDASTDSVTWQITWHIIATHTAVDWSSFDIKETVTSLGTPTLAWNTLTIPFSNENWVVQTVNVNLSGITPTNDIHISTAAYNAATNVITLTETTWGGTFTINLSEFSITTSVLPNGDIEVSQEWVVKFIVPKNAWSITYDNSSSWLTATTVQSAIDEIISDNQLTKIVRSYITTPTTLVDFITTPVAVNFWWKDIYDATVTYTITAPTNPKNVPYFYTVSTKWRYQIDKINYPVSACAYILWTWISQSAEEELNIPVSNWPINYQKLSATWYVPAWSTITITNKYEIRIDTWNILQLSWAILPTMTNTTAEFIFYPEY